VSERLDELLRWEASGGHWEVASDDGDVVRLALRTCLGDEVVGELVSSDSDVRQHLAGRNRDD
jgi:hypothetical protein